MCREELDPVAAWRALLLVHAAAVRAIEADLARAGKIPLTWYDVLLELNAAPGRKLRIQDLTERVVLSQSRVSRLVEELRRAGLITREADPTDRRVSYAVLTAEGRRRFRRAAPVYLAAIRRHFTQHLSEDDQRRVTCGLERVLAGMREGGAEAGRPN